jgi:hypothetical protein
MRNIIAGLLLVGVFAAAGPAWAKSFTLTGTHGRTEVAGACGKSFQGNSNGYYGCEKACKGGKCSVWCKDNGVCTGTVPGRLVGKPGLTGVLSGAPAAVAQ